MRLISDPRCSLSTVAQAISADPPLAIKTLRLVNTAYYGLRQKVSTIEHAVVLLGIKVVKNLAFTATVFDIMKGGVETFYRHSVTCGMAMRALVEAGGGGLESAEEAFVCGLLHDIGKVILDEFFPKESAEALQLSIERRLPAYEAERAMIGVDHALIGARMAQRWKLAEPLVNGVAGHHVLSQCESAAQWRVAALVSIADYICYACAVGARPEAVARVQDEAWAASGLTSEVMPAVMERFFGELPLVDELMRLTA
jgi:putative nucleotidyltransferase with HDIG domain